jgi:dihydrodipicolinate synthase/N-acetylneuraminate lyase
MELLAKAMRCKRPVLGLGVQGKGTEEMLAYARRADEMAPDCFIAMPPSTGKSQETMARIFDPWPKRPGGR